MFQSHSWVRWSWTAHHRGPCFQVFFCNHMNPQQTLNFLWFSYSSSPKLKDSFLLLFSGLSFWRLMLGSFLISVLAFFFKKEKTAFENVLLSYNYSTYLCGGIFKYKYVIVSIQLIAVITEQSIISILTPVNTFRSELKVTFGIPLLQN